jgi:hypothetical protein
MPASDPRPKGTSQGLRSQLALFGPPPLIEGEDATAYERLLACFRADMKPVDIHEEIWVHDIGALVWDILRRRPGMPFKVIAHYTHLANPFANHSRDRLNGAFNAN